MFIKLPFSSAEVLLKNARALRAAVSMAVFDTASLATRAGVPKSSARLLIKNLKGCELVRKVKGGYTFDGGKVDDGILLNIRDEMLNPLFRRKVTRELLLHLVKGQHNLKRMAEDIGVARMTLVRVLKDLRTAGLVEGRDVAANMLYEPSDRTELIPRSIHRKAVRYFIGCLETRSPCACSAVLYGEATHGAWSAPLKLAVLVRFSSPETAATVIKAATTALDETVSEYEVPASLSLVTEDAWFAQKFNLVETPHLLLLELLNGIFVYGEPPRDEEYFELVRQSYHIPQEKLESMLRKGHIRPYRSGYSFTEKGIKAWRKKPINIIEFQYPCNGKKVPIISVGLR
jgi:predicted transcriptional regulator